MHIANHKHLHTTKGTIPIAILPQHRVYGIKQISPYHRYLVNNNKVNGTDEPQLLPAEGITLAIAILSSGNLGTERQLKEGMNGNPLGINSGNTRRSHHNHTLRHFPTQFSKESGLTRSCLSRQKQMRISISYDIPS